ncbi:hypothetical protein PCE1_004573 [Barthelona sp. PCE]
MSSFSIGLILALSGSVVQNVGLSLMKRVHNRSNFEENEAKPYFANWRWFLCFLVYLSGAAIDLMALSYIPLSLVLPIGSTGLFVSAVLAVKFNGESFTRYDLLGTLLIFIGAFFAVLFSPKSQVRFFIVDVLKYFDVREFSGIYLSIVCMLAGFLNVFGAKIGVYAGLTAGLVGCFGNLLAKLISELISTTLDIQNQFQHWGMSFLLFLTIITLLLQNHLLQLALRDFDQILIIPTYYITLAVSSFFNGLLVLDEFDNLGFTQIVLFAFSLVFIFFGVFFLSKSHGGGENRSAKIVPLPFTPVNLHNRNRDIKDYNYGEQSDQVRIDETIPHLPRMGRVSFETQSSF